MSLPHMAYVSHWLHWLNYSSITLNFYYSTIKTKFLLSPLFYIFFRNDLLQVYLEQQKRMKAINLFGVMEYGLDYDYKQQRTVQRK
jgi:hypothetical protein